MASICQHFNLYDVLLHKLPHQCNIPTYISGSKRLDYFLLSSSFPEPNKIGHLPYNLIYNSDHCTIFSDLPLQSMFSNLERITTLQNREIHSNSLLVKKFVDNVHKYLIKNAFKKLQMLAKTIHEDKP